MRLRPFILHPSSFILLSALAFAQQKDADRETDPLVLQKLEWFQDQKFGLLMHWGPYSQWGIVESWSICPEDVGWAKRSMPDYNEYMKAYEALPRTFNPVRFHPEDWAAAARDAGMRYVVFTTKHHDGFCMFDTRQTSYRVTDSSCPFSRHPRANIAREIFAAFRAEGLGIGAYFSKPDWHSPFYWSPYFSRGDRNPNYVIARHPEWWKAFCDFTYAQIEELMTGYGPVDILWLDGGWVRRLDSADFARMRPDEGFLPSAQSQDIDLGRIAAMARGHQPGLIIVDRAVPGRFENYITPEQEIPAAPLEKPWETCMTMASSWSYVATDTYKPARQLIRMLMEIVSKGGNFLVNVGPAPDGSFPDSAYARMRELGAWMRVNGEAVYATRAVAPYGEGPLRFTRGRDGALYAVCLASGDAPPEEIRISTLPLPARPAVTLLGYDGELPWSREGNAIVIHVPDAFRSRPPCAHAWTVKIAAKQ